MAALLALESRWVGSAASLLVALSLLWLAGQWVVPRGRDELARYYARIRAEWDKSDDARFLRRLETIKPPTEVANEHEALLSAVRHRDMHESPGPSAAEAMEALHDRLRQLDPGTCPTSVTATAEDFSAL